jgi:hypothetical protein
MWRKIDRALKEGVTNYVGSGLFATRRATKIGREEGSTAVSAKRVEANVGARCAIIDFFCCGTSYVKVLQK